MSEENKNGRHTFSEETRKKLKKRGLACMLIGSCFFGLAVLLRSFM